MIRTGAFLLASAVAGGLVLGDVARSAPAQSVSNLLRLRASYPVSLNRLGSIYSFTPSTADARLAAVYARALLNRNSKIFRFTPTSGSVNGRRSVTVLVRAPDTKQISGVATPSPRIAPLAYSLDISGGWRKIALPETAGRKPLDPVISDLPGAAGFSLSRPRRDIAGSSGGVAQRALVNGDRSPADIGSSYSLTKNINVTAGVRDPGKDDRLTPITDKTQDRQAVYVGTTLKF